jgi:hypothetical protein
VETRRGRGVQAADIPARGSDGIASLADGFHWLRRHRPFEKNSVAFDGRPDALGRRRDSR